MNDYETAEKLLKKSLDIKRKITENPAHPRIAVTMHDLYINQKKFDLAKKYLVSSVRMRIKILGRKHPDTALGFYYLGVLYFDKNKYSNAKNYLQRALAIQERILGNEHPDVAVSQFRLGKLFYALEKYDLALPLYRSASKIFGNIFGTGHRDTIESNIELKALENRGK